VIARIPVGRVATTAAAVLFLASPAAWFVNGTSVLVDSAGTAQWRRHSFAPGSPETSDYRSPRNAGVAASAPLTLVRD
jgi:hypothetical protein